MACDLLVIGGGVMGAATAWQAARDGADVVLLERFAGPHPHGSSHGRSRIFRLAYDDPAYVALARAALVLWRELEAASGAELLAVTGGLDHGRDVSAVAAALDAAAVPYERPSPGAAAERWPMLRCDADVVFQPDAGRLDADAAVATLHAQAARHGADVRFSTAALAARETRDGVVVETTGEPVAARRVVVAAGAWLPGLLPSLPAPPALPAFRVTQEQPVYLRSLVDEEWPAFIHHVEPFAYYGLGAPGDGVKAGEHGSGRVVTPDARLDADTDAVARVEAYAAAWLPGAEPVAARVDSCLYTSTPDTAFAIVREGPVTVCSPCSGHGFKFAPQVGRVTAGLALR